MMATLLSDASALFCVNRSDCRTRVSPPLFLGC
jgi:hypothetical protein